MEEHALWNPADPLGIAIVVVGAIATVWVYYFAVRCIQSPGERDPDHPKYSILRDDR
jgi:hypothetical protein